MTSVDLPSSGEREHSKHFEVSVPILLCLIPMFEKRKPFLYFLPKVGPLEERFHEIFGKP